MREIYHKSSLVSISNSEFSLIKNSFYVERIQRGKCEWCQRTNMSPWHSKWHILHLSIRVKTNIITNGIWTLLTNAKCVILNVTDSHVYRDVFYFIEFVVGERSGNFNAFSLRVLKITWGFQTYLSTLSLIKFPFKWFHDSRSSSIHFHQRIFPSF